MKVIVCPDSFKGTLTAREAAGAIGEGIKTRWPGAEIVELPVGDGGEGTIEAMARSLAGAKRIECLTTDPLRRPLAASYIISEDTTALIESAAASGLTLLEAGERDIMRADTFGTGLLIADAYRRGIRDFVVCMGGTATCDGGHGAWQAIKDCNIRDTRFTLLCDVDNPLCGPNGAAAVFAPQKGATPEMIPLLDMRLMQYAREYEELTGTDVTSRPYAGAAGGLAGMLMACYGALPVSGIEKVLEILDFDRRLEGADVVITGEGRADRTTLQGKAAAGILKSAKRKGVPVVIIGGQTANEDLLLEAGFEAVISASPCNPDPGITPREYLKEAAASLELRRLG